MNVNNLFYRRIAEWKGRFQKYTKTKFFREGLPFILFVVIGSFGLREVCAVRYELSHLQKVPISEEDHQKMMKHEEDLVQSFKKIDYENWENKRLWRESDEGKIIP